MTRSSYTPRLDARGRGEPGSAGSAAAPPQGATILVVDDDADVRAVTRRALETHGYEVAEAADGVDAIRTIREHSGRVSLVLTDVVMWRMGGSELSACLASLYPGTRMLFMSGYREDALRRQGLLPAGAAFIAKPFAPDALAEKAHKLLGRADASQSRLG